MRQTLASVVTKAEPKSGYASEYELYPNQDWHKLSDDSVSLHDNFPYPSVHSFLKMKLQVYAHCDLGNQGEHHYRYELPMHIRCKLTAFVLVSQEVSDYGEKGAGRLDWDVPFRAYYLPSA